MEIDYKAIGRRVKLARTRKNLTQENVAEAIGVSAPHMSNIETGSSKVSLPTLIALSNVIDVSVDELLCDNVIRSKAVFEREMETLLTDCDDYEIRVLTDVLKATKASLRRDAKLRSGK